MKQWLIKFLKDEEGATVVEYAVMLVLIILVALATITLVGQKVDDAFDRVQTALES